MESTSDRLPSARPCMCVCPTSLVCSLWLNSASPEPCKHFILGGLGVDSWQESCETNEKNVVFLHEGALFLMVNHTKGDKGALRPPKPCCRGRFWGDRRAGSASAPWRGRPGRSAPPGSSSPPRRLLPVPGEEEEELPAAGGTKLTLEKFPRDRGWGGEGRAIPGSAALRRAPSPHGAEQRAAAALEAGAGAERPAGGAQPPGLPVAGGRHRGGAQ